MDNQNYTNNLSSEKFNGANAPQTENIIQNTAAAENSAENGSGNAPAQSPLPAYGNVQPMGAYSCYIPNSVVRPVQKRTYNLRDSVCALICFFLGFIFTRYAVGYAGGLWGGIFWLLTGITGAVYVKAKEIKITFFQFAVFMIAELFCFSPLFCSNGFFNVLSALFSFLLLFYIGITASGAELFGKHFVVDALSAVFARPFVSFEDYFPAVFALFKKGNKTKNVLYVLLGLLIALPLTLIVVFLLMRSDSVFENTIDAVFSNIPSFSFGMFWQLVFAVPVGMYIFGMMFSASKSVNERRNDGNPIYRFLPAPVAYTAVTPICVFYLVYVITQLGYFTAAFGGELPKGYSYAEFARRGFFELCVIAVINLCVIMMIQGFTKREENDKRPRELKVYTVLLSVFTLLLIVSAMSKMILYINNMGMTQLRVYTSWFMILLALVFVLVIIEQVRKFALWKAIFAVFTVMLGILCFGNIDGMIARHNVNAYLSGELSECDIDAMEALGYAAVEPVAELMERAEDSYIKTEAKRFLERNARYLEDSGFGYFSLQRAEAERACERVIHENVSQKSEEFYIILHQEAEKPLYGVHYEYYVKDTPIGGAEIVGIENGNVIPIEPGETISLQFNKRDFPENADLNTLSVELYIIDQFGNETKAENDIKLSADYGNNYDFILTGDISNYSVSETELD